MIRYFALAFIFFQVATTAALATQVVLFEDDTAAVLPADPMSGAQIQPISPQMGNMAGRPEGRTTERLLIQIDTGKTTSDVAYE